GTILHDLFSRTTWTLFWLDLATRPQTSIRRVTCLMRWTAGGRAMIHVPQSHHSSGPTVHIFAAATELPSPMVMRPTIGGVTSRQSFGPATAGGHSTTSAFTSKETISRRRIDDEKPKIDPTGRIRGDRRAMRDAANDLGDSAN